MARSPFYKIILLSSDRDISELVTTFRYEHAVDEDNLLEIRIETGSLELLNSKEIKKGDLISFIFGYLGADQSIPRRAKVKKISTAYDQTISLTITSLDDGYLMKRVTSDEIHSGTASEIVLAIAKKFKLEAVIEETQTVYKALPQGNKSYYAFLKHLAVKEGGGDGKSGPMRLFTDGAKLFFTRRDLTKDSTRTYEYNNGEGEVISFTPKDDQDLSGAAVSTTSEDIDLDSLETKDVVADNSNTQEGALGDNLHNFDINGFESLIESVKKIFTPADTEERKKNLIGGIKNNQALGELTANLDTTGDPSSLSDTVITMAGVADDHLGNWYISKAIHTIDKGGYITSREMKKNASKTGDDTADNPNKSIGPDKGEETTEIKIFMFDENGFEIP